MNGQRLELRMGNRIVSNLTEVTELINMYFSNSVEKLAKQKNKVVNSIKKQLRISQCPSTIFIHPVTEDEVVCVAEGLKDKLSADYDDIPVSLIKKCITLVKKPLVHIYNISLNSDVFPNVWKIAKVIPLYKKGDRSDYKNYRPISVLPVFSKMLERVMFNRLITFVIKKHDAYGNSKWI
jgi:hypothetical protein